MSKLNLACIGGSMLRLLTLILLPLTLAATPACDSSRQLLAHLALQGHERILDLGCGDGSLTAEIAQQVSDGFVLGLDRSEAMIRFADQAYDPELIANLQFKLGDAHTLEYEEKFDIACLFDSLQWMANHQGTFNGIAKGLKKGGKLCLVVPLESKLDEAVSQVRQKSKWRRMIGTYELPHLNKLEQIVEKVRFAKLAPIHVETEIYPISFLSEEALVAWLTENLPEAKRLALSQRQTFAKEVGALFTKLCGEEIQIEQPTLSMVAIKR